LWRWRSSRWLVVNFFGHLGVRELRCQLGRRLRQQLGCKLGIRDGKRRLEPCHERKPDLQRYRYAELGIRHIQRAQLSDNREFGLEFGADNIGLGLVVRLRIDIVGNQCAQLGDERGNFQLI